MWPFCQIFGCPFKDDNQIKEDQQKAKMREELDWWRENGAEEGISYGGSVYVEGQRKS
jgi:hypothetical protein